MLLKTKGVKKKVKNFENCLLTKNRQVVHFSSYKGALPVLTGTLFI